MENTYPAAFAALDEALRERIDQVTFVSPLGDQSTEIDSELETAAFVSRPDPNREIEAKQANLNTTCDGTGMTPFAIAAGLYDL